MGPALSGGVVIRQKSPDTDAQEAESGVRQPQTSGPSAVGGHQDPGRGGKHSPPGLPEALISDFWLPER